MIDPPTDELLTSRHDLRRGVSSSVSGPSGDLLTRRALLVGGEGPRVSGIAAVLSLVFVVGLADFLLEHGGDYGE
ncbi:hypothetical protein [Halomarina rubra]|uniref:Uncharacterized protein n=1 Tax=Halomarina rubra TaxID=2071873 RepID=A0ABD6AW36_9EURY|nr:hypothetical protein [Halomarina rubra]